MINANLTPEQHEKWFWHAWPICFSWACHMAAKHGDEFSRFRFSRMYDPHWYDMYFWNWISANSD